MTRALVVATLLAAGCGSYTSFKTTRLPRRGATEWFAAAELQGAQTNAAQSAPMPELVLGGRRRVHEWADVGLATTILPLGAAMTSWSIEASSRVRVFHQGRWSAALGPGAGYRITRSSGAVIEGAHVALPLILGVDLGCHQVAVSPTVGTQRLWSTGARPVDLPFAGFSVGVRLQVAARWAVLPEATVGYSPERNFMTDTTRLFNLGVAVTWTR